MIMQRHPFFSVLGWTLIFISSVWFSGSLSSCSNRRADSREDSVIGPGQVPALARDGKGIYLVYGKGDSILFAASFDKGQSFSRPVLVDTIPQLFSFAMRGPQIAALGRNLCIIACTKKGNIFSYIKTPGGAWTRTGRVNDLDTMAKEGFLALAGNQQQQLVAVWLDLRNGHNNLYGARSEDGGKTWLKNEQVYASPDDHICECCKPSVAMAGNQVAVMFRNHVNGDRDLYLTASADGGRSFTPAKKLGKGSWKLDGCPMDGGGLVMNPEGSPQTVWQRRGKIFAAAPGTEERELGEGKACTMAAVQDKNIYAWVEKGEIVLLDPKGNKIPIGKGSLPVLQAVDKDQLVCVWENDKQIEKKIIHL